MLAPFVVTANKEILDKISDSYNGLSGDDCRGSSTSVSDIRSNRKEHLNVSKRLRFKLGCKYIAIEIPLSKSTDGSTDGNLSQSINHLFERSGYVVDVTNHLTGPTLSLAATDFDMNLYMYYTGCQQQEIEITTSLHSSVASLITPMPTNNSKCQRFDIISIDSETQIDPDALIKIEYSKMLLGDKSDAFKKKRAKNFFPYVVPLASVKASQQFDHEDESFTSKSTKKDGNFTNDMTSIKRNVRGADPQVRMLKEACSCENNVLISIPSIAMDLSINEKNLLLNVVSELFSTDKEDTVRSEKVSNSSGAGSRLGLSFRCNQFTFSLHHHSDEEQMNAIYTQLLIWDGLHLHCLLDKNELKHIRLISEDLTLYESESIKQFL